MMSQPWDEVSKLNQQFRNEIRRKDIHARFAERRKQYLQEESNGGSGQGAEDGPLLGQKLGAICNSLSCNSELDLAEMKELARISCSFQGSQAILRAPKELLGFVIEKCILIESALNTQQQLLGLFVLSNCLVVSGEQSIFGPGHLHCRALNDTVTSEGFLLRVMSLAMETESQRAKQHCLSVIFCIVFNNEAGFILTLVTNPTYNLIHFLQSQMYTQPTKSITIETLRIFYLVAKKLNFPNVEQLAKIRKLLHISIKSSNSLDVTLVCVVSLHALLRSLPAQRINKQNLRALDLVMVQAASLNHNVVTTHTLKTIALVLSSKCQLPVATILLFFTECIYSPIQQQSLIQILKMTYDIIVNCLLPAQQLAHQHIRLISRMDQMFQSNMASKAVVTQLCYCMSVLAVKLRERDPAFAQRVRARLEMVAEGNWAEEKSLPFLQNSLQMLGSGMGESGFEGCQG